MMNGRAEDLYVGILFALAAIVLWGGACDGYLWLSGQPTITDILRAEPRWFYGPMVAILTFVALLTTHLYLTGK